jgi:hypothetical protein
LSKADYKFLVELLEGLNENSTLEDLDVIEIATAKARQLSATSGPSKPPSKSASLVSFENLNSSQMQQNLRDIMAPQAAKISIRAFIETVQMHLHDKNIEMVNRK